MFNMVSNIEQHTGNLTTNIQILLDQCYWVINVSQQWSFTRTCFKQNRSSISYFNDPSGVAMAAISTGVICILGYSWKSKIKYIALTYFPVNKECESNTNDRHATNTAQSWATFRWSLSSHSLASLYILPVMSWMLVMRRGSKKEPIIHRAQFNVHE